MLDKSDYAILAVEMDSVHDLNPPDNQGINIMDKEYWDEIARLKDGFVKNGTDPRRSSMIKQEVAESWIRSKNNGIMPDTSYARYIVEPNEYQQILKRNSRLIEVTTPILANYLRLAMESGYTLALFDRNGVFIAGRLEKLRKKQALSLVLNETTIGTSSHFLAMHHKKPFQLIGPENYLEILHQTIATSAPILDENDEVIGALLLARTLGKNPWERDLHNMQSHSLGWISSLALAIQNQFKLQKSNDRLRSVNINLGKANEILGTTLEFIDEGIITVEPDGTIIRLNPEGNRILRLNHEDPTAHNIREFLSNRSTLLEIMDSKKNADYIEELIVVHGQEKPYLISVRPVIRKGSKDPECFILRLNHPEKINALVAKRSGANANFSFEDIIGESESILKAKSLARKFAVSPENILLLGESGTGKELFAQAIHNKYRPCGPFIAVNCAAIPRNLFESELFGYESGAFTGAEKKGRPGKIELANGGTLFLDEIGDMPYEVQSVILRVLQDKKVMRLGSRRYQEVDFRLIAATNKDLLQLVQNKLFREDLYFRLSVLNMEIPPLRERGNDKLILAEYFIERYSKRMGWPRPLTSEAARNRILEYNWPGNVRQLENAIIYAVNVAEGEVIDLHHLPKEVINDSMTLEPKYKHVSEKRKEKPDHTLSLMDNERIIIERALAASGANVAEAGKLLGVSRATLYRKLKKLGIDIKSEHMLINARWEREKAEF